MDSPSRRPRGAPRQVLDLARSGTFTLFTSPDLLSELADVLGRNKFSEKLARAETSVEELVFGYASRLDKPLGSSYILNLILNCNNYFTLQLT